MVKVNFPELGKYNAIGYKRGKGMLFSVEQAFAGRDERQAPLKMLAREATEIIEQQGNFNLLQFQYD